MNGSILICNDKTFQMETLLFSEQPKKKKRIFMGRDNCIKIIQKIKLK